MKKFLLSLTLGTICLISHAQNRFSGSEKIYIYGVDYAPVKVWGASESPEQFVQAFREINDLLLHQADKYTYDRICGSASTTMNLDPIRRRIDEMNRDSIKINSAQTAPLDVETHLRSYALPESEGVGIILIAKLLDKAQGCGTYYVVGFDVATREPIFVREITTKAGGFGLRNFWANTVYQALKKTRIQ
ncbi:hypothetical protein [uncultured Rikenella sp.]|uniref:hypothetical protein n=1 Tax=uncultured Rikenella sp. TaxID=368003 RepID=UPI00263767D0|nr:hypothetical protein [uncultured Rikenella sp.]